MDEMIYRQLGKTGERVSALGLGGFHMGVPSDPAESIRIVHAAIDGGITFMDNSWDYHGGESEVRMGRALKGAYRDRVFLMTKIDGQTRESAASQLDQCLQRLGTDRIDLVQLHEIIRMEDPDRIFAPGGAIEAMVAAKEAGKIRFIGFTGHKDPQVHLKMLDQGFAFDTVQMPLNCLDAHFRSFEELVLPVLVERGIGVLGMKPLAAGKAVEGGVATAEECLRYAMSLPTSVVITGCESVRDVEQALRVGRGFCPMDEAERRDLLARTRPHALEGRLEEYKTTRAHDGTVQNPHWLTCIA